jgi:hypothetical protein
MKKILINNSSKNSKLVSLLKKELDKTNDFNVIPVKNASKLDLENTAAITPVTVINIHVSPLQNQGQMMSDIQYHFICNKNILHMDIILSGLTYSEFMLYLNQPYKPCFPVNLKTFPCTVSTLINIMSGYR